jgi:IclR family acetate operon transcriptional repressor
MSQASSAERVFQIMEMYEREKRPLSLRELSDLCQIPGSTCHSLVHTLLRRGYLYQTGRRKDLYPTRRLYEVSATIVAHDPVLQRIQPTIEKLRDDTQETVILGRRQKDQIAYLEVLESPQTIRYSAKAGDLKPLHSTCIGKTILATLTPQELRDWIAGRTLNQITDATITTYSRLMDALEEGKRAGYFISRGENVAEVTAVAIPVRLNEELFGIAVAGPAPRVDGNLKRITSLLIAAQRELLDSGVATL